MNDRQQATIMTYFKMLIHSLFDNTSKIWKAIAKSSSKHSRSSLSHLHLSFVSTSLRQIDHFHSHQHLHMRKFFRKMNKLKDRHSFIWHWAYTLRELKRHAWIMWKWERYYNLLWKSFFTWRTTFFRVYRWSWTRWSVKCDDTYLYWSWIERLLQLWSRNNLH